MIVAYSNRLKNLATFKNLIHHVLIKSKGENIILSFRLVSDKELGHIVTHVRLIPLNFLFQRTV